MLKGHKTQVKTDALFQDASILDRVRVYLMSFWRFATHKYTESLAKGCIHDTRLQSQPI